MAAFQKRSGSWRVIIRKKDPFTGGLVTESKSGFATKPEAAKWAATREESIEKGVHGSVAQAESTTLVEALERYERDVTPAKKGARQERVRINAWKRDPLALRVLSTIRGADIAAWRDKRLAGGASPTTVRNDLALISHLFATAIREWGMESLANPVEKIKLPAAGKARDRRLDPTPDKNGKTEEQRLLAAAEAQAEDWPWLGPIIKIGLATAMRQSEILGLSWENVDLSRKVARLLDTKNGDRRDVPLSTAAVTVLESLLIPDDDGIKRLPRGPVFPVSAVSLDHHWRKAVKAAGSENLRFHDLRHEATSRLFEKGLNPMEAAAITGHKTLAMLKRYTHLRAEDLAAKLG